MRAHVWKQATHGGKPDKSRSLGPGSLAALVAMVAGCGEASAPGGAAASTTAGDASVSSSATSTTSAQPATCLSATAEDGSLSLLVDPANNYAFDSTVTFDVQLVAPNSPLSFDWSGLSIDLMKQPIDPAGDVAAVLVSLMGLTVQEFQDKLNANEMLSNESEGALAFYPTTQTRAHIYEFSSPGDVAPRPPEQIDPYLDPGTFPPETHTFAVLIQDDTEPARGVRMVQAFRLDPNSVNAEVTLTNDSSDLVYQTDLTQVVPVQVPVGTANITADWRGMTDVANNALGDPWLRGSIEEVMIARYDLTPAQLTEQFLGLENIAAELYRAPVPLGSTLHLSTLVEETSGAPFTGISSTGTWILALNCLECTNPAPWFLTILRPCP